MGNAYKNTAVSISKSQESIRQILRKADVRGVQFSEDFQSNEINVRFAKQVGGVFRTVSVSMRVPAPPEPKHRRKRATRWVRGRIVYDKLPEEKQEQMTRATYRALHYWLKSQFEAVDFGLLTFEKIFLSHFEWMMKDGTPGTLGDLLIPQLQNPQLTSGGGEIPAAEIDLDVIDAEVTEKGKRRAR